MTCGVYEIWCGPYFYQGSSKNVESRVEVHQKELEQGKHKNPKFQNAFNKYGWTSQVILIECEEDHVRTWEQAFLDTNWGNEKYLNLSHRAWGGGVRGRTISAETRAKHRARELGRTHSEERCRKNSEARKGKKQSPEMIEKRMQKIRGRPQRPEVVAARSARMTGKKLSEEHRKSLSESHKGKVASAETRAKMSAARKGKKLPRRSRTEEGLTDGAGLTQGIPGAMRPDSLAG